MRRFFVPPEHMDKGEASITGSDAHHLRDVLRLQPDDLIITFDGTGREYEARVVSVTSRQVRVEILIQRDNGPDPTLELTIAQGYLKDKKMDGLVRRMTELGVARWAPFLSRRSVPEPDQNRLQRRYQRWRRISMEALKQCGRNRALTIDPVISFNDTLNQASSHDAKIIFWEGSKDKTAWKEVIIEPLESLFVMVGPEGGFERDEVALAEKAGFVSMGLGPRVLRAETAALAAVVVAQFVFGDMG